MHADPCLCSPRRRAFFIPFLRRLGRLDDGGGQFPSVCTLVPCLSSPHRRAFFFPFLRRLGRFDCDGGDFPSVCTLVPCLSSPHRRAFFFPFLRRLGRLDCDGGDFPSVCTLVPCLSPPHRRAFFFPFLLRLGRFDCDGGDFPSVCTLVPCLSSPHRRAFFFPFLRRLGRFDTAGGQFPSVCTLAPAVPRFTGVHFLSRFSAALDVSTLPAGNFPPCARWPLPFFASPACIFYPVSPPPWTSRRCRRAICLRLHAGLCLSSPRRRAFFFRFPASLDVSTVMAGIFPPCARWYPAFLHLAGVHFLPRFSAALDVSILVAGILPPCARWPLPFFISPACIFYPVSPPAWTSRRCRRAICFRVHAGPCRSLPRRRAFFFLFPRQLGHLDDAGGQFASVCTLALPFLASPACIFLPVSPPAWPS